MRKYLGRTGLWILIGFVVLTSILGRFNQGQTLRQEKAVARQEKAKKASDKKTATIDAYLSGLSVDEKVGQMFLARVPEYDQVEAVASYNFGGYILFGRDFEGKTVADVTKNVASYQKAAKVPLLVASDEEGGTVTRISQILPEAFKSPLDLYQEGGLDAILKDASNKVTQLKQVGIYTGMFPVADLATDKNAFIYDRTIGQDAKKTADYIAKLVTQLDKQKFGSNLKHFPGYGNNGDSHTAIIYDERSLDDLKANDFLPFEAGIKAGADSVLLTHNIVTALDSVPASISPAVNQLLRKDMGFTGVVMTDDFDMEGLTQFVSQEEGALRTIQAGTDMIITSSYGSQIPYITKQVKEGKISEERIDESVRRILAWKYDLGLLDENYQAPADQAETSEESAN